MKANKKDIPLMDRVHAWTFQDKLIRKLVTPEQARIQRFYRDKLKVAQRFTLDDDAVRLIAALSKQAMFFPNWSILARIPFDVIWIEYDNFVKLKYWSDIGSLKEKFDPTDVNTPARTGYLMYKEDPGKSERWILHDFSYLLTAEYGPITVGMLDYVFDPVGDARFPVRGSSVWKTSTISLNGRNGKWTHSVKIKREDGSSSEVEIDPELIIAGMYNFDKLNHNIYAMPDWLSPRLAVTIDPWWTAYTTENNLDRSLYNAINMDLRENAGHFRWVMTMLATLCGLPRDVRQAHSHPGKHSVGMHQLPYFGSSIITFRIPKGDTVLPAAIVKLNQEANNTKRRWHMVIGHWRVMEYNKGVHFCKHMPVMQEEDIALCERCGMLVRWIQAHGRGDATIGVVDHQYKVTT